MFVESIKPTVAKLPMISAMVAHIRRGDRRFHRIPSRRETGIGSPFGLGVLPRIFPFRNEEKQPLGFKGM